MNSFREIGYKSFITLHFLISFSCVHNYEPEIKSITAQPNPVNVGQTVILVCNASDDDESSMLKDEALSYRWEAVMGDIISENEDNNAIWTAPDQPGEYSISCIVEDKYYGMDIATIEVVVQ